MLQLSSCWSVDLVAIIAAHAAAGCRELGLTRMCPKKRAQRRGVRPPAMGYCGLVGIGIDGGEGQASHGVLCGQCSKQRHIIVPEGHDKTT
jgi:hypothetical protein